LDSQQVFKKKQPASFGGTGTKEPSDSYQLAQREAHLKIQQYGLDKKEAELKEREKAISLILNSFKDRESLADH
jgi:hypothetical protein